MMLFLFGYRNSQVLQKAFALIVSRQLAPGEGATLIPGIVIDVLSYKLSTTSGPKWGISEDAGGREGSSPI